MRAETWTNGRSIPNIERVSARDLTPTEKDRLLDAIVHHMGREIERCKFDGEEHGSIDLVQRR